MSGRDKVDIVIGRLDTLEAALDQQAVDIAALGRGVSALLKAKREDGRGQPDWIAVDDPAAAVTLLEAAATWVDKHAAHLGLEVQPCWPWHPSAVVVVLALAEHYRAAYRGHAAPAVTDYLTRTLPAGAATVRRALGQCTRHEHQEAGDTWTTTWAALPELARWWATDRDGIPPGLSIRRAA